LDEQGLISLGLRWKAEDVPLYDGEQQLSFFLSLSLLVTGQRDKPYFPDGEIICEIDQRANHDGFWWTFSEQNLQVKQMNRWMGLCGGALLLRVCESFCQSEQL
jgi:hypothetical protein